MKLFHVSDKDDIKTFIPRPHIRKDVDPSKKYVWAIDEKRLVNYLLPRNCPRVCIHAGKDSSVGEVEKYIPKDFDHVIYLEDGWRDLIEKETLYIYTFDQSDFVLQDDIAGYYVSESEEVPVNMVSVDNLLSVLRDRKAKVVFRDEILTIRDEVIETSLNWSCIRMKFAKVREGV